MSRPSGPLDVLVVGWFPAADEPIAGRFVADQVAALHATGRIRPWIATFENAALRGDLALRARESAALVEAVTEAARHGTIFNPAGVAGPDGIPVARLAIGAGSTASDMVDHRAGQRTASLLAALDDPEAAPWQLVHGHVGYPEGVAAAGAAARLGVPYVITEHATFLASVLADPVRRRRYEETLTAAARVVAVSSFLGRELVDLVPAISDRLRVIPNAVATQDFRIARAVDRRPDELLWVGMRKEVKGIVTLLQAFRIVLAERPAMTLRLVGRSATEADEARWKRLAGELGIAAAVRFDPPADRAGVATAMSRATAFVHPSDRETFGIVAAEALASGLPVVARDSGGVTEVLGDDRAALGEVVFEPGPEALAQAILRTVDRRDTFDPVGMRGYVETHYGARTVADRIATMYEEVLDEAAPARPRRSAIDHGVVSHAVRAVAATPRSTVLVGFSRLELDRVLARFPTWVTEGVVLVTSGPPVARAHMIVAPAGLDRQLGDLIDWGGPGSLTHRLRRLVARRFGRLLPAVARSRSSTEQTDRLLATLTDLIGATCPAGGGDAPLVVCLSGIDHLAAAPLIAAGRLRPAPGGVRWLADFRLARGVRQDPARSSDA